VEVNIILSAECFVIFWLILKFIFNINGANMCLSVPKWIYVLVEAFDIIVELSGFVLEVTRSYIYRYSPISFATSDKVLPLNNRYSLSSPIKTVHYMYADGQFFRKYAVSHLSCPAARLIHRTESRVSCRAKVHSKTICT
jgi:hypothetical protein